MRSIGIIVLVKYFRAKFPYTSVVLFVIEIDIFVLDRCVIYNYLTI